jgi:hypothetical protein
MKISNITLPIYWMSDGCQVNAKTFFTRALTHIILILFFKQITINESDAKNLIRTYSKAIEVSRLKKIIREGFP